ncbi:GTPase IMAP family member 7 [Myxocyprinus asiaticus]|uniref:GTPase IMAP family member 7 n=1 Tax=Myxocyprinus asiaticus TaxID=70543 RepID=UPI0022234604|nr:GTPase IMAP family member 7 [Myxocyprinus asiaticus]
MPKRGGFGDEELRIVVIGSSGQSQFFLTNFILGREEYSEDVFSISGSQKNLGELEGRQVAVVNAPNLYDEELSKSKMRKEMRRSMCLSTPGPHAILLAFDLEKISSNDMNTLKLVMKQFGENVLNYTMILLVYDGQLRGRALHDKVMRSDCHLTELVEQCSCCYHVFSKNWRNRAGSRELLHKIERMLEAMGGHYYINRSYKKAEESVRNEERKLRSKRQAETKRTHRELEKQFQGDELRWQKDLYNASVGAEIRATAEMENSWLRTSLARGLGLGFVAGATMGMIVGSVEGPPGMVVGGAVGGVVGGVSGAAVQLAIEHLDDRVGPHATSFNSAFVNRFYRAPNI